MTEHLYEGGPVMHFRRAVLDASGNVVEHRAWTEPANGRVLRSVKTSIQTGHEHTFLFVRGLDEAEVDKAFVVRGRALRSELQASAEMHPTGAGQGS